jgi:predicted TIM-barrel fold metal-dependent hydrolase
MSTHRRQFLAASTAAVASLTAAEADPAPPFRIDCQSHLFCPEILALMEKRKTDPTVYRKGGERWVRMGDWHRRVLPNHSDVDAKLAVMDRNGIALTALSINDPGPEWFGEQGPEVARVANDFIAGVVKRHPTRFFGLCVLPLQDVKASVEELDRCVDKLGMKGILLYTNLAGKFPDQPEFRPLFARAAERDLPLLLHPALPVTASLLKEYELISGLGNMFDNTIALTRLIVSGVFDRHPDLKLVCPHLGGTLPYVVGRIDHQFTVLKRGPRTLKKAPSEYLKQVYLDIVSPLPLAMKFAYEFAGPERLLFSSDHPWVDPALILDHLQSLKLPAGDERKIVRDNARKLFRL